MVLVSIVMALLGLKLLVLVVCVLVSVAFFTLFEQKVLGYMQRRKGPNKVGVKGLLQPFSDAIKLFTKEVSIPLFGSFFMFMLAPMLSLWLMMVIWLVYPMSLGGSELKLGIIYVMCCMAMGVYPLLWSGWSSNSKYALLGGLRAVAQTISYEVSFSITLLSFIVVVGSFYLGEFSNWGSVWLLWLSMPLATVWFISALAETSRTPFDFSEGESELVSGFNTEYSAGPFALFFIAEYGSILFMAGLFSNVFLGGSGWLFLKMSFLVFVFVWVRATMPRLRYDKLMWLNWVVFLPTSLLYLYFFTSLTGMY